jgi:hypothetical protein
LTLTIRTSAKPALTITRTAVQSADLVYVAVANVPVKYPNGYSRIVYIGKTAKGAKRIAQSAAAKANEMLGLFGVSHLELFVVTCSAVAGNNSVDAIHKLERGLILAFKDNFGEPPRCNTAGKKMIWTDEENFFTYYRLNSVIEKYSN